MAALTLGVGANRLWARIPSERSSWARHELVLPACESTQRWQRALPSPPPLSFAMFKDPPGPLQPIPPRSCTPVDLGGVQSIEIAAYSPMQSFARRLDNSVYLRSDGRYEGGAFGEGGCFDQDAAGDVVRFVRARSIAFGDPEHPLRPAVSACLRVRWRSESADVVECRVYDHTWEDVRARFLARSPSDATHALRAICDAPDAPVIAYAHQYDWSHEALRVEGAVRADGTYYLSSQKFENGGVFRMVRAGRFDRTQVRLAAEWLAAHGWEGLSVERIANSPRSAAALHYDAAMTTLFGSTFYPTP